MKPHPSIATTELNAVPLSSVAVATIVKAHAIDMATITVKNLVGISLFFGPISARRAF